MNPILATEPVPGTSTAADIQGLFAQHVVPTYSRFDLAFTRGAGSYLWDTAGQRYLDMGAGIAVCCLGHAHPELSEVLARQSHQLVHISNLYYHEGQGRLAQAINRRIAPGKCFFANSGAEANEGLFKLARKFGHSQGRFEIITALNSFHGRTLAGIAATGQTKVKIGFEPTVPGFVHVPYNDLQAIESAISPATVALMIEGIQGEGGITPASPGYLTGLRRLCDEKNLLLLMDGVQDGHYRTGRFQSFQRLLENTGHDFLPDAISMAKSIGGGFPIGAFWVRQPHADLLGPGSHACTFGGTPLACAVALKTIEIIERDSLADNARVLGEYLRNELEKLKAQHGQVIKTVRGVGLMIGLELHDNIPGLPADAPAIEAVQRLHEAGLLTIPAGKQVLRLLPPLNLARHEADEALQILGSVLGNLR